MAEHYPSADREFRLNETNFRLLQDIAAVPLSDISTQPSSTLRGYINFHREEYLHFLMRARTYAHRAEFSKSICDSSFTALTSRMNVADVPADGDAVEAMVAGYKAMMPSVLPSKQ